MPFSINNVEEMGGSPNKEIWTPDGLKGTRVFRCNWDDRRTLAAEILGITNAQSPDDPLVYPGDRAGFCRAKSVSIMPEGILSRNGTSLDLKTSLSTYEKAILTVEYDASKSTTVQNGVVYEESLEPSAEFVTLPHFNLYWDNTQTTPVYTGDAPSFIEKQFDWVITRYNMTSLSASHLTLMGQINAAAVTSKSLGYTFAAKQLLFHGTVPRRQVMLYAVAGPTGSANGLWTATSKFTYKTHDWNLFWKPGVSTPQMLYTQAGAQFKPYTEGNFLAIY